MPPDQEKAEQIILEILRKSKSGLNKGQLYKTFWIAHLYYAQSNRGYLSDWPIVIMPKGPGIDKGPAILGKMSREGVISMTSEHYGPFTEHLCKALPADSPTQLTPKQIEAIALAVEYTSNMTATELSALSHEKSRGWRDGIAGQEIDIYADIIPDEEIEHSRHEMALAQEQYQGLFE